jgi:hypothetical protein
MNLVYSASQLVEVLGLVIGSGSLASLVAWWSGSRDKVKAQT